MDSRIPCLIVGDQMGNIIEVPELIMAGTKVVRPIQPNVEDLLPLPKKSKLLPLKGRVAIGYDPVLEKFVQLREYRGKPVFPVAALLPFSYIQKLRCAFSITLDAPRLPNHSFTAVGMLKGAYLVAALPLEPLSINKVDIEGFTINGISYNSKIKAGISHLEKKANPLLQLEVVDKKFEQAVGEIIAQIRAKTSRGVLQVNTTDVIPSTINTWCKDGLDSIQLCLNSAKKKFPRLLNQSCNTGLSDLIETVQLVRQLHKKFVLKYKVFPGLTDHPLEMAAFEKVLMAAELDVIRLCNLEIDPEWYMDESKILTLSREQIGIHKWWVQIKEKFPEVHFGY